MKESYDLSNKDLRMMRDYLDDLSGVNSRGMPEDVRGRGVNNAPDDLFRTMIKTPIAHHEEIRFDTQRAWAKVSSRIGPDNG